MCTAISYVNGDHYFGRNLDLEYSFQEQITITPRKHPFSFLNGKSVCEHYAMIGTAYVCDHYPLYYDAANEMGLCAAGLNFEGNAVYAEPSEIKENGISPYELIPFLLSCCASVADAIEALTKISIVAVPFSQDLPLTPLHWLLSDKKQTVVVESVADGMKIYENTIGILTNNPPFPYHLDHLSTFMLLSKAQPKNRFSRQLNLKPFSLGMGAIGLPGDFSSVSRFVKAAFVKENGSFGEFEEEKVGQLFHMLASVEMPKGCVETNDHQYEYTQYSSCCNATTGIYYYRTYDNSQINAVNMRKEKLDSANLVTFPLNKKQQILFQN